MTDIKHTEQFLNSDNIEFYCVRQKASENHPYFDFEFSDGNPRTVGVLTYNVEEDSWYATVGISEDEDSEFDDVQDATPDQLEALMAALPEDHQEMVASFKAEHDLNRGIGRTGFSR